jgi:hypothetical protein
MKDQNTAPPIPMPPAPPLVQQPVPAQQVAAGLNNLGQNARLGQTNELLG